MYYIYLLHCSDDSLYCGYTTDLMKRLCQHNSGKGAKYTRARLPVELVYSEVFRTKSEALRREAAIKKMSRQQKLDLIKEDLDNE